MLIDVVNIEVLSNLLMSTHFKNTGPNYLKREAILHP